MCRNAVCRHSSSRLLRGSSLVITYARLSGVRSHSPITGKRLEQAQDMPADDGAIRCAQDALTLWSWIGSERQASAACHGSVSTFAASIVGPAYRVNAENEVDCDVSRL
jgi:hypothetical protein